MPQDYYKFPKDPNQRGKVGESMLKFYYVIENAGKFNFSYTLFINVIHFSAQSSFFSFVLFFSVVTEVKQLFNNREKLSNFGTRI